MTDLQAKNLALWLVKEWAIENAEDECQACGGCGHVPIPGTQDSRGDYAWEPCGECGATGVNAAFHDRENFLYYEHDGFQSKAA